MKSTLLTKWLSVLGESLRFASHALVVNKLRTLLSLLGITIGIFAIISVYTVVDSLELSIRNSVSQLGSDVVYVQKWPWGGGGGEFQWWKYMNRPEPSYREFKELERRMYAAEHLCYGASLSSTVKRGNNSVERTPVLGVTHNYLDIWKVELDQGRYYSKNESSSGRPVAIIGPDIADALFGSKNPLGQRIKLLGRQVTVIGVFKRVGKSLMGQDTDEMVLVPLLFMDQLINLDRQDGTMIMVKAKNSISLEELKQDLRGHMRALRRLKPKAEDNFALNEITLVSGGLDAIFYGIGLAGTAIGGFSILVGGFGIANIMFVSVKERTNQIGIQKSLGARNSFILSQFLFESVLLSLLGGAIGLLLVFALVKVGSSITGFDVFLTLGNVITGLGISLVIGLVSGIVPAFSAARMDPVEAIRTGG